jgi:WD40 repeat protein/pimeloyl-ACP methyl ester carboxylesterase
MRLRGRSRSTHSDEVDKDLLAPSASPDRRFSLSARFDDWKRRRSLTPNGSRETDRRWSDQSPKPNQHVPSPSRSLSGTFGLRVLYQPRSVPVADIVFVHGLGGDIQNTWSKDHDPKLFWPQLWLPLEPDIGKARILSFGYNASFHGRTPRGIHNITDFAKELLYDMKFGKDKSGEDLEMGGIPIIFVMHSMGGLVAKKAYLLGQNDEAYRSIIQSISAMMFLATPHHGTDLAEVLNRLLQVLFQRPGNFIADLKRNSPALDDINEQFRHVAPKLDVIASFYEKYPTPIISVPSLRRLTELMVLDHDSSVLRDTKEISRDLDADHHGMCKFSNVEDSNYVIVRNQLSSLVKNARSKGINAMTTRMIEDAKDIERLFAIPFGYEDDFTSFRRLWTPGTCDWLLGEPAVKSWLEPQRDSSVVWVSAPPASGKSILSTHIIRHLRDSAIPCQFFFFRFDDPSKRSLNSFLRSMAYQLAKGIPAFRRIVLDLSTEGLRLEKADSTLVWKEIFESILFQMEDAHPLYWIIDALDESESPEAVLDLLQTLPNSRLPIRIYISSRKTEPLSRAFDQLAGFVPVHKIEIDGHDHNASDIHLFVERELKSMRGSDELRKQVAQSIETRAQGNFLWVRLVVEEVRDCHTEKAIQETLDEIPNNMTNLYRRMELAIINNPREENMLLGKALLQWTICASRALTLKELTQALKPEFPNLLDLKSTIQEVCGQFISVNDKEQVAMVHQTARDYLLKGSKNERFIDPKQAHAELFSRTISTLLNSSLRPRLTHAQQTFRSTDPFVFYAAVSWMYHLRQTRAASDDAMDKLVTFFKSPCVLAWIHCLALTRQLEVLVKAAKVLSFFGSTKRKLNAFQNPLLHRLSDLELLDEWAVDLIKVVGKFGKYLLSNPLAIYTLVPAFCPEQSILRRQFYQHDSAGVALNGFSNSFWSDNLAKIALPNSADQALKITCAGQQIAALGSSGTVYLWNSENFSEACTLRHQEPVTAICLNQKGNKLVSYGLRNTKLWSIPSGQLLSSWPNPEDSKAMSLTFSENDTKILAGSDDKVIRFLRTGELKVGWQILNEALLKETLQVEGTNLNSPVCMAFNGDGTQVGVSYRGFPLSVWALKEGYCVGRCTRSRAIRNDHGHPSDNWFAVDRFTWNPVSGHIIGLYKDGSVFKWHPVTSENYEARSAADEITASSDGKLFVTSNSDGTVRVWNFTYFSVIYQLSSTDLVTGLTFSPDCRRFYDLRGSSINAWEPNSLIRFSETEESFSDAASDDQSPTSISNTSEACLVQFEAVSALAVAPCGPIYCFGNEEGVVDLHDSQTGEVVEVAKFLNFLSVSQLSWSQDATHVVTADLGGEIVVKRLVKPSAGINGKIEVMSLPSPKIDLEGRGIHQMLFNHNSTLLLVISDDSGQIWAFDSSAVKASARLEHGTTRRWLQHPTQKHFFLAFGPNDVQIFRWQDFTEHSCLSFREDRLSAGIQISHDTKDDDPTDLTNLSLKADGIHGFESLVNKAMLTQDGKRILVQTKESSPQGRILKRTLMFDITAFAADDETPITRTIPYSYPPPNIMAKIDVPLGILPGSKLAFLDQDLWLCTFRLGSKLSDEDAVKRQYFIPRDWTTTESVELCCMMEDGTLLCPKDDKVAVIRSSLNVVGF